MTDDEIAEAITAALREVLRPYEGQPTTPELQADMLGAVLGFFDECWPDWYRVDERPEPKVDYMLEGDTP